MPNALGLGEANEGHGGAQFKLCAEYLDDANVDDLGHFVATHLAGSGTCFGRTEPCNRVGRKRYAAPHGSPADCQRVVVAGEVEYEFRLQDDIEIS